VKLLTDEKLISLVESSGEIRAMAEQNLAALSRSIGKDSVESIYAEVVAGKLCETVVQNEGRAAYVIFWFKSEWHGKSGLNITCAVSVCIANDLQILVLGAEKLARQIGAEFITFHTRRLGLIERARKYGYECGNIELVKML
jgi:hypothetical protein